LIGKLSGQYSSVANELSIQVFFFKNQLKGIIFSDIRIKINIPGKYISKSNGADTLVPTPRFF
jgi:hypothetical protein